MRDYVETLEPLLEDVCDPDIAVVCLTAVARQEVGLKHAINLINRPDSEEGHTVLLLERSTDVQQELHDCKKCEIAVRVWSSYLK